MTPSTPSASSVSSDDSFEETIRAQDTALTRSPLTFMRDCAMQALLKTASPHTIAYYAAFLAEECKVEGPEVSPRILDYSDPLSPRILDYSNPRSPPPLPVGKKAGPAKARPQERTTLECRAIATWIGRMVLEKLVAEAPFTYKQSEEIVYHTQVILGKSLRILNPPAPLIIVAVLYLFRIFPKYIPYHGNCDQECSMTITRLYLLCLRFAVMYLDDIEYLADTWTDHMRVNVLWIRNVEIRALFFLQYNLVVAKVDWIRWVDHLIQDLRFIIREDREEHHLVLKMLESVRPSLASLFSGLNLGLTSPGLPIDKDFDQPEGSPQELDHKRYDLADCITWGATLPLRPCNRIEIDPVYLYEDNEDDCSIVIHSDGVVERVGGCSLATEMQRHQRSRRGDSFSSTGSFSESDEGQVEYPPVSAWYPSPESVESVEEHVYEMKPVFNPALKRPAAPAHRSSFPKSPYPLTDGFESDFTLLEAEEDSSFDGF